MPFVIGVGDVVEMQHSGYITPSLFSILQFDWIEWLLGSFVKAFAFRTEKKVSAEHRRVGQLEF